MVTCSVCGIERDERKVTMWQSAAGWIKVGRKVGGPNAIKHIERKDRFMCNGCMTARDADPRQGQLPLET